MQDEWTRLLADLDQLESPKNLREDVERRRAQPRDEQSTRARRLITAGRIAFATVGVTAVATLLVLAAHSHGNAATTASNKREHSQTAVASSVLQPSSLVARIVWIKVDETNQASYGVPVGSDWMEVVFDPIITTSHADAIAGFWYASLLAWSQKISASSTGGLDPAGVTYAVIQPDGTVTGESLHTLDDSGLSLQNEPTSSASALTTEVKNAILALGLDNVSIGFVQVGALGPYPVVSATYSGDGSSFQQDHPDAAGELGLGDTPVLLNVTDASGQTIEVVGVIPGAGDTLSWRSSSADCQTCVPNSAQNTQP